VVDISKLSEAESSLADVNGDAAKISSYTGEENYEQALANVETAILSLAKAVWSVIEALKA
jgi:hypothetical protein